MKLFPRRLLQQLCQDAYTNSHVLVFKLCS